MGFRFASNGHNRFSLLILYFDKEALSSMVAVTFDFMAFKSRLGTTGTTSCILFLKQFT